MSARGYAGLWLLGLFVGGMAASFQAVPGYMDADYYFATGRQLASGEGLWEPFLWNYLDDPSGLPHPGNTYWMPLGTFLAAFGMWISGASGFQTARLGFMLLAACLPPLSAALAMRLSGSRRFAILAGCLAAFPGFYLVFLPTTDTFGLYAVLGTGWLLTAWAAYRNKPISTIWQPLALGVLSGLMHLARADGGLWLGLGLAWWVLFRPGQAAKNRSHSLPSGWRDWVALVCLFAGYLLVIGPWVVRNLAVNGMPFSAGAARALWIMDYDELYLYPGSQLTSARWWAAGQQALQARLDALGENLQTALAVQGQIILAPLVILGAWRLRADRRVQLGLLAWGAIFLVMTLLFPFQGARGGFFHSGAALQPLFWALAPFGLQAVIEWGRQRRRWDPQQAWTILGGGLVVLALIFTSLVSYPRLAGGAWGKSAQVYRQLEQILQGYGAQAGDAVLVNNPPGYFAISGRPALAIPDGDADAARAVAQRYGGAYLLLESNHPRSLDVLYLQPESRSGWRFLETTAGVQVFRLERAGQ